MPRPPRVDAARRPTWREPFAGRLCQSASTGPPRYVTLHAGEDVADEPAFRGVPTRRGTPRPARDRRLAAGSTTSTAHGLTCEAMAATRSRMPMALAGAAAAAGVDQGGVDGRRSGRAGGPAVGALEVRGDGQLARRSSTLADLRCRAPIRRLSTSRSSAESLRHRQRAPGRRSPAPSEATERSRSEDDVDLRVRQRARGGTLSDRPSVAPCRATRSCRPQDVASASRAHGGESQRSSHHLRR